MRKKNEISQVNIPEGTPVHLHIAIAHINGVQHSQLAVPAQQPQRNKIKWAGTPEEFVETFAPMIHSRKLYLKSKTKSDTAPIVRTLYNTFEIHKVGDDTEIAEETLVTYFKKYFAPQ
jgi:hypothetical protein